jgi:hypothetical protein
LCPPVPPLVPPCSPCLHPRLSLVSVLSTVTSVPRQPRRHLTPLQSAGPAGSSPLGHEGGEGVGLVGGEAREAQVHQHKVVGGQPLKRLHVLLLCAAPGTVLSAGIREKDRKEGARERRGRNGQGGSKKAREKSIAAPCGTPLLGALSSASSPIIRPRPRASSAEGIIRPCTTPSSGAHSCTLSLSLFLPLSLSLSRPRASSGAHSCTTPTEPPAHICSSCNAREENG